MSICKGVVYKAVYFRVDTGLLCVRSLTCTAKHWLTHNILDKLSKLSNCTVKSNQHLTVSKAFYLLCLPSHCSGSVPLRPPQPELSPHPSNFLTGLLSLSSEFKFIISIAKLRFLKYKSACSLHPVPLCIVCPPSLLPSLPLPPLPFFPSWFHSSVSFSCSLGSLLKIHCLCESRYLRLSLMSAWWGTTLTSELRRLFLL